MDCHVQDCDRAGVNWVLLPGDNGYLSGGDWFPFCAPCTRVALGVGLMFDPVSMMEARKIRKGETHGPAT